uniref:Reverse transcriptase domain-containing protein n=1 Tax=Trichuris muris TaxID=70415 RepID=A0A5S6R588_TRIMR
MLNEATVSAAAAGTPESDHADVHEEAYAAATPQKTVCFSADSLCTRDHDVLLVKPLATNAFRFETLRYENVRLVILPNLCVDVILDQDFQRRHESLTLNYFVDLPLLTVCDLTSLRVDPPMLFAHLSPDCHPVATKSRRFTQEDTAFVLKEIQKLLNEGVIELSISPWRAQVLVTKDEKHSYPLPRIDALVQNMAKYKYFSTTDLKTRISPGSHPPRRQAIYSVRSERRFVSVHPYCLRSH